MSGREQSIGPDQRGATQDWCPFDSPEKGKAIGACQDITTYNMGISIVMMKEVGTSR
jgi:hypothetical protein